jgi:hypothetical protein
VALWLRAASDVTADHLVVVAALGVQWSSTKGSGGLALVIICSDK